MDKGNSVARGRGRGSDVNSTHVRACVQSCVVRDLMLNARGARPTTGVGTD